MSINRRAFNMILRVQMAFSAFVLTVFALSQYFLHLQSKVINVKSTLVMAIIIDVLLIFILLRKNNEILYKISHFCNIICLPTFFLIAYYLVFEQLLKVSSPFYEIISFFYLFGLLYILLPLMIVEFDSIKRYFWRFWAMEVIVLTLYYSTHSLLVRPTFFNGWDENRIFLSLILLFCFSSIWGITPRLSLKFHHSSNFSLLVMILLIAFTLWYDFFETYLYNAKTLLDAICLGQIAFAHSTQSSPTWVALFLALQIGLFEELTRYVFILICLNGFKSSPYKVWLAILFSTLEFSLGHALYIFSGESLTYVITEVVFTFGFGALMAVLFLYSGKLWLAIIGHGLCDFAGMVIVNNSAGFLSRYDSTSYLALGIITVLPLVAAVIMMTGKRGRLIKENATRLTKSEDEPILS